MNTSGYYVIETHDPDTHQVESFTGFLITSLDKAKEFLEDLYFLYENCIENEYIFIVENGIVHRIDVDHIVSIAYHKVELK